MKGTCLDGLIYTMGVNETTHLLKGILSFGYGSEDSVGIFHGVLPTNHHFTNLETEGWKGYDFSKSLVILRGQIRVETWASLTTD